MHNVLRYMLLGVQFYDKFRINAQFGIKTLSEQFVTGRVLSQYTCYYIILYLVIKSNAVAQDQ